MPTYTPPLFPTNEKERLNALRRFRILDTGAEIAFDRIVRLTASICGMPISVLSFVDANRQWFKSKIGLKTSETPRDISFCGHTILDNDVFVIADTFDDPRFKENPLVLEEPNIRFYAGAPLITSDGFRLGALCAIDTTPHKEFSERDKENLADLAKIVMGEMEARLNNQAKADFLAMASHEIRTPINGIVGIASLLRESTSDPDQQEKLDVLISSSETLLHILNDLLDLSKIDAQQLRFENMDCDFERIASETVKTLTENAAQKGTKIEVKTAVNLPWLKSDPFRLRQILTNLVGNAIKFTENGKITIDLSATPHDATHYNWTVRVRDTGTGIAMEDLAKLFEPFAQVGQSSGQQNGTGLGLTITKHLVERLGGIIDVQSEVGKGTTFSFTFSAAIGAPPKASSPLPTPPPASITPVSSKSWRILVGEDNLTNQTIVMAMLQKMGHKTRVVEDGLDVLSALEKETFDLLLLDIQMPKINGFETAEKIRSLKTAPYKKIPIVAMTAHASTPLDDKFTACGFCDYLLKPFTLIQLRGCIERNLSTSY